MKLKFMIPRQAKKDLHTLKEKIQKEELQTAEGREIEEKEKEVKKMIMKKVVENKVLNRRPPMFSCIHLRKRQQCCKPKAFIRIKQGSNSVQDNVWKKYYVILFPQTFVIFFLDGHGLILKRSILMNVPFI